MSFVKLASSSGAKNKTASPLSKATGMSILSKGLAEEKKASAESGGSKNKGGFLGGLGFAAEKLGLGVVSAIEGVWDYAAGGVADLFGADRWAERQFANDWVNYNHADEWYNPSTGWKIAGDVFGGIGTSAPAIGMAFIPGPGWVGAAATAGTTFLSGAGNATKEAYKETGKLEYGYGALVGATEAGIELASAGIGTGTGRIVKAAASRNAAKQTAKQVTKTVSKTGAKQIAKKIGADFASEAIEEGISEILTPQWQKVTYNPDAENASIEEIAYAALVGGLSGAMMTGSAIGIKSGINTVDNLISGRKSMKDGTVSEILKDGKAITDLEIAEDTGIEPNMSSKQIYENLMASLKKRGINTAEEAISLAEQGALNLNVKEQMYLGKLKKSNALAALYPEIERAFLSIVHDPKTSAERYSKLGMKYENGQRIKITEKEILEGIDLNLLEKARANTLTEEEARAFAKNYRKALSENSVLATVAAAEATGRIMVNSKRISDSLMKDQNLANGVDIYRFIKTASPKRKQAVAEAFGIENWDALTNAELAEKITEFRENGGTTKIAKQMQRIREAEAHRADGAMPMPQAFKEDIADGFYKFKDTDSDIGVFKEGDEYFLYNYETKDVSKPLTKDDVNAYISRNRENIVNTVTKKDENISKTESKVKKGEVYFEDITESNLNDRQKQSIKALRFLSNALGIDIYVFESQTNAEGKRIGENGWYDPSDRSIHIDLYAGAEAEALMLYTASHELTHHIKNVLPEKFNILASAIKEEYINAYGEERFNKLLSDKKAFLTEKGRITKDMSKEQVKDLVYEEVIADCCETMLLDSNALEELSKNVYTRDKSLWQKIKDFLSKFFAKIKSEYKNVNPDSEEGLRFRDLGRTSEKIQKIWTDAIVEASKIDTIEIDSSSQSVAPVMASERTWAKSEYVTNRDRSDIRYSDRASKKATYAPDFEIASGSIEMLERPSYKERIEASLKSAKSGFVPGVIATEIQFTNVQAGVEHAGKVLGVKNIEALVQSARASRAQAQEMLGGGQWYIPPGASADKAVRLGDGLEPILSTVRDKRKGETKEDAMERYSAFQYYLAHKHNVDRMSLEQKSLDENKADVERYKELKKELLALSKKIKANKASKETLKGKYNKAAKAERARLKAEISSDTLVFNVKSKAFTELKKKINNFVPDENKPVLRKELEDGSFEAITATESKDIVKLYEEKYPEFKGVSEKLYKFLNNLLKIQADSGLITQELYEELIKKYPHYVPTYRVEHKLGTAPIRGKGNIEVTQTVKKATGSLEALEDFELSISRLVQKAISASNVNILGNALVNAAEANNNTTYIKEVSRDKADNLLENGELEQPKNNQISIYRNGERITYAVTHEVFLGFDSFNTKDEAYILPVRAMAKATSLFKTLVTSANPIFLVRNFVRDLQDAGINTNYSLWNFAKHYVKAIKHLASNSEMAQLYRAAGGFSASIFDYVDGFVGKQSKMGFTNSTNKTKWLLNKIENLNMFVEQLPRFAEFLCAVESGKSVDQAILEAADVTTNFGRSGKLTKTLNNTVIPFLNPAVQGLSKIYRNIKTATKSWKAAAALIVKCIILGITPMVLNNLLYNDDDDYKEIKDTDKENNYLFRVGDTWFKVPKGRVVSVLAGAANRTGKAISGEDPDVKGYLKNVVSQVTPVENITRPIWQPIFDAKNNKTWYGGEIEGRQFENVRPSQRYDESTSEIAKWLGEKFNYSPKKIHYVLDQYSGVIGDFVLPATTQKAQKSFVVSAFVFDPVTSNKLSDDFYKLYEEAKYKKSEGDETAKYQLKHLNEVKSAISDMYDEISKIQQSDLSNAEKLQQTRVIRVLINNAYKTARDDYELYTEAIELTAGHFDESTSNGVSMRYAEINRQVYGAEKALETYSSKVYEKMKYLNLSGIDYETLYVYYFGTKDIENDLDKKGEVISGSKRKKTVEVINKLKTTREQKLLLICASGYAIKDGDIRGLKADTAKKLLLKYILSLKNTTKEQKEELARICGFEVKNGKIILK